MKRGLFQWQTTNADRLSAPPFLYLSRAALYALSPLLSPFVFNQRGSDLRGIKAALNHRDSTTILPLHEDR